MFDTMTITKIVAAVCAPLLIFLLGSWAADVMYLSVGSGHGENETQAYIIETEKTGAAPVATQAPDFAVLLAAADPAKGKKTFTKCKACHKIEKGVNATGPSLYGVVGRKVDSVPGYSYSGKLEAAADVWTPANLNKFLTSPKAFAPGTKMGFAGLKKETDRANVVAYLETVAGTRSDAAPAAPAATQTADTTQTAPATAPAATAPAAPAATQTTTAATATATPTAPAAGIEAKLASADLAKGKKVFNKCKACHSIENGKNKTGPSLYGVVGRKVDSEPGYKYSGKLEAAAKVWTPDNLDKFLTKPRAFAPGTKMGFSGLSSEADRINVIGYLQSVGG